MNRDFLILDETPEKPTVETWAWFNRALAEGRVQQRIVSPVKRLRAGHDFPCALHKGPKGDCNERNCRCA